MFGIKFNRLVAATAVLALCCGASFAAGPKKMGMHKMTKVSAKKTNLVHKGKTAKLEQPEQNLSEEELFALALESKNISKDGNTLTDTRDGKTYKIEIRGDKAWMKNNLSYSLSTPKQCLLEDSACSKTKATARSLDVSTATRKPPRHAPTAGTSPTTANGATTRKISPSWTGTIWARAAARIGTATAKAITPVTTGPLPR